MSGLDEVEITVLNARSRRGEAYRPVKVNLKARARTDELDAFLRRFAETDLLHRVNSVAVGSVSPTADVDLTVDLEAEAVSLPTATDRNDLFPVAELVEPLPEAGETATVTAPDDPTLRFPAEAPFAVRAGRELLNVVAVEPGGDGAATWTLARGADGTDAADHAAGAFLQLWPRKGDGEARLALSETGPFRKPRVYEPRLNVDGDTRLVRGDDFKIKATATDFDDRFGDAALALADPPAGLALDPETGEITLDPAGRPAGGGVPRDRLRGDPEAGDDADADRHAHPRGEEHPAHAGAGRAADGAGGRRAAVRRGRRRRGGPGGGDALAGRPAGGGDDRRETSASSGGRSRGTRTSGSKR